MSKKRLEEIRKIRLEKVNKLRKLGINPYVSKVPGKATPVKTVKKDLGKTNEVVGRLWSIREHGNCCFADIKDSLNMNILIVNSKKFITSN